MDWEQFQNGAQASQSYDDWYQQALQNANNAGGDAGWGPIRPDTYFNDVTFKLPGQEGNWTWDASGNQFMLPEGGAWQPGALQNVNVIHDNGTGNQDGTGVYQGQVEIDNRDTGMDKFMDTVMPLAVAAITAYAGGAAIGGAMGGGEAGAAAGSAGQGAEAAPTFTYGNSAPAWSQAGGTELGSGLYGTDPGSMAGLFGTTADTGVGLGSGIGSGIAADGGVWAGAGGGWAGLAGGASDMLGGAAGGMSLGDAFKTAQQVYKYGSTANNLLNALNPPQQGGAGAAGGPSGGFASYGGTLGTGGLAQALAAAAGVKTRAPGEAEYTDMTSEIGQIPMLNPQMPVPQQTNNNLPQGKDSAMINRSKLGALSSL